MLVHYDICQDTVGRTLVDVSCYECVNNNNNNSKSAIKRFSVATWSMLLNRADRLMEL